LPHRMIVARYISHRYPHIEVVFVVPHPRAYLAAVRHLPLSAMSSRRMQSGCRREVGQHHTGDQNVQIDIRGGRVRRIGVGLIAYADTACRSSRRMRGRALSWTGRRVPSFQSWTLSGRLFWPLSRESWRPRMWAWTVPRVGRRVPFFADVGRLRRTAIPARRARLSEAAIAGFVKSTGPLPFQLDRKPAPAGPENLISQAPHQCPGGSRHTATSGPSESVGVKPQEAEFSSRYVAGFRLDPQYAVTSTAFSSHLA